MFSAVKLMLAVAIFARKYCHAIMLVRKSVIYLEIATKIKKTS